MLKNLVQIKSTSGGEAGIQKFIFEYLSASHLRPFYVGGNVVVKISGRNKKSALIFNTHVDTVSPGELRMWKRDPYKGTVVKGKFYGLGASDEKSAVSVNLKLAKYYSQHLPECDLWLTFVVKEEVDGSGTKEFVKWFKKKNDYRLTSAILGEPTGLNSIDIAHKGNIFLKVTAFGDSGHGSSPEMIKKHAVYQIFKADEKLKLLSREWASKYKNNLLHSPTIGSFTSIQAGNIDSPNKFPDKCFATFDIRTIPKMHNIAMKDIRNVLKGYKLDYIYKPVDPGYTNSKEKIVGIFQKITGVKLGVFQASTDMCFFTKANIPAVIFGPGEKKCMHKANEYCYPAKMDKCFEIYKKVNREFGKLL